VPQADIRFSPHFLVYGRIKVMELIQMLIYNQQKQEMNLSSAARKYWIRYCCAWFSIWIISSSVAYADPIRTITDKEVPEVIASTSGKLVIHLSSFDKNCGYCVNSNPIMDDFAKEFSGKSIFVRVVTNPWNNLGPEMGKFAIFAFPVTLLFKDGKLVQKYYPSKINGYESLRAKLIE
jgi:thiol-disulfide isomerase/thioredoxin